MQLIRCYAACIRIQTTYACTLRVHKPNALCRVGPMYNLSCMVPGILPSQLGACQVGLFMTRPRHLLKVCKNAPYKLLRMYGNDHDHQGRCVALNLSFKLKLKHGSNCLVSAWELQIAATLYCYTRHKCFLLFVAAQLGVSIAWHS